MPPVVSFFQGYVEKKELQTNCSLLNISHSWSSVKTPLPWRHVCFQLRACLTVSTSHYVKPGQTELAVGQQTQLGHTEALLFNKCI